MATPPGAGGEVPQAGYYPDPSIPGYIRYWNGGAWVPGTSRPAPREGELPPAAPVSAMPPGPALAPNPSPAPVVSSPAPVVSSQAPVPAVEETGPVFLDEDPAAPEPASAWQADVSRQTGFGGDRDRRVSWGAPETEQAAQDPRVAAARAADPEPKPAGPSGPQARLGGMPVTPASAADPTGGALPGVRQTKTEGQTPVPEGTMTIRALPSQGAPASPQGAPASPQSAQSPQNAQSPQGPQGTRDAHMPQGPQALRAPQGGGAQPAQPSPAPLPHVPGQPQPQAQTPGPSPAASAPAPVTAGPGGGAPSWPQQVHQLAQPAAAPAPAAHQQTPQAQHTPQAQQTPQATDQEQPVLPWKPPVEDPFLQAARAQAAARPAGLGKRLVARFIDTLVLGALAGGASFPFVMAALDHIDAKIEAAKQSGVTVQVWLLDGTTSLNFGIALGALLVLGVLYEALPTAKWGRTLGKKLCGLQVRDIEAHEPPTFGAALRRWLVYSVLGLLVLGVLNVLWCLFDRPWRQCWHDKAAHTFVAG
ncbi:RDD family protein [Streptomyces sp. NPDC013457]|uniref:RDD family protein n=1 Tax=Streptomyces sp. NPDC013457 TaxID=3364866 RepID=UPI0036F9A5E2